MELDYVSYDDYTSSNESEFNSSVGQFVFSSSQTPLTPVLVTINVFICVFGFGGNSLVLWICGCKMKRTVITTWYISLAVSNLVFCSFLPLEVFYLLTLHWPFGSLMCKLTSSVLFLNMYSSVFLLALISVDRCLMVSFPVWSQNRRRPWKALALVGVLWACSALLTVPSMMYRRVTVHGAVTQCFSDTKPAEHAAVVQTRFVCGFVVPFFVIVVCGAVLVFQLKNVTLKSTKPYKILSALICSFFVCWVPYHTFFLLELKLSPDVLHTGLKVGATLASANSFMSPVLYVFIGNDFKTTLRRSVTSRIETALAEDLRSRSKSMELA